MLRREDPMEKDNLLSIDIGSSAVKAMIAQGSNGKYSIVSWGSAPSQGYVKGQFEDFNTIALSVRQAVDCAIMAGKSSTSEAVISLNSVDVMTLLAIGSVAAQEDGLITNEDVQRAMTAAELTAISEDQQILHCIPVKIQVDNSVYDFLPEGLSGKSIKVLTAFVTVPKTKLIGLTEALSEQKVEVKEYYAAGFALSEALKTRLMSGNHCIIMDVGSGLITIAYYYNHLIWTANLPLGGDYIIRDLMQALHIHRNHAEQVKYNYLQIEPSRYGQEEIVDCNDYGTSDKLVQYDFLYDVIESRIDELITLAFEYIKNHLPAETGFNWSEFEQSGKLYLTGGYAKFPSFINHVERVFHRPAEVFFPDSIDEEYRKPENTVCYGLLRLGVQTLPIQKSGLSPWQQVTARLKSLFRI